MKNINWPKHSVLIIAIVATWITTYIGYTTSFNMKIDNMMQEFILFMNPLSFSIICLWDCAIHEEYEEKKYIYFYHKFVNINRHVFKCSFL